ncbi:MAG: 30S ribosomal protein S12 methylthiotransferase RimO [Candidatus Melainabacteria bacterium]|nr:MAG: 30S ribosomal protein S12 methylthiotransferase RimO [Candidatus Melainabacteria bacterium]
MILLLKREIMKISLINHGCAKNLVDAELMLGMLAKKGYTITLDETDADIVIVNTCSFIHDAEKESVQSILQMIDEGKKVIVTGCLSQKHDKDLKDAIPELAGMIGTSNLKDVVKIVDDIAKGKEYESIIDKDPKYIYPEDIERQQITVGASSYLKIGEGCNYQCGYCIIPKLRGKYNSRPIENIVKEANELVNKGVTEIILIAQDTSSYGIDLYGKQALPELLEELNKIENLSWIRIMYAYPTQMTDELIDAIAKLDKVVKYVDIPLQHSHPRVLESMRRPVMDYRKLVAKIRERIPNVSVRTSLIVGYPGETEEEFEDLYQFVKDVKFDRMGAFEYSREKGTYSDKLKGHLSEKVKRERRDRLMKLQQQISLENNEKYIGSTIKCIVEGYTDDEIVILRSEHDAPEIDGVVYAKSNEPVVPGDIEEVKITRADEYDLFGEIV